MAQRPLAKKGIMICLGKMREDRISRRCRSAFTLIELLVVIAVVSLLMSILIPALSKARAYAHRIVCCSNLRQLQLCWLTYVDDNDGKVPSNMAAPDAGGVWRSAPDSWIGDSNARLDPDTTGIENGAFFTGSYNRAMKLYRCGADKSRVRTLAGVELGMKRTRSYSMNTNFGGPKGSPSAINSAVAIRKPARLFVFLDEHESFIDDASFTVNPAPGDTWSNIPADRHSHGCDFSFADGHAEHWRWRSWKNRTQGSKAENEDLADLRRLQEAAL